jgi:tRNA A-37 threonylcarbamoyl transferase component Bud32
MNSQSDTAARLSRALEGRYRIEQQLGAGGMATVYRAQDLKHDRRVAIKVLHADLSAVIGGDRFLAEIKTTAALQHPHILPLFDSGSADGLLFYVMPLVEGDTLRDRLNKDKQLSISEALRIATEVAGALDYAHRRNVIHRDIKPENVLLQDGSAVVADFGIALAVHHAGEQRMTQTGLSLGTPQYMSPEQAMGEKSVDKRSDVYALGAVLYEMLTGEPPFSGATVQAIVAKVLTERPGKPSAVRDTIPPHVEATVLTALAKLPADRFATAAQFAEALARPEATASYATMTTGGVPAARASRAKILPWAIAAVSLAALAWKSLQRPAPPAMAPLIVAELSTLNRTVPAVIGGGRPLAMSADGSQLAFLGVDSTRVPRLFVRALGTESLWPVPESEFGAVPAFSASGKQLAYLGGDDAMMLVGIGESRGRALYRWSAERTAFAPSAYAWEGDSAILFTEDRGIHRIRAAGGEPTLVLAPPSDSSARYTSPIPTRDGRAILLGVLRSVTPGAAQAIAVLRRGASAPEELGVAGSRFQLVNDSILVFFHEGTIRAVVLDPRTFKRRGDPTILSGGQTLVGQFGVAASREGVLAFVAGSAVDESQLVIVDRSGTERAVLQQRAAYRFPRFSPEGERVAYGLRGPSGPSSGDLWVTSLRDGRTLRVTSDGLNYHPEWARDGRSLFHLHRDTIRPGVIFRTPADGTSPPTEVLTKGLGTGAWEFQILPDQRTIVFRSDNPGTGRDIAMARIDSARALTRLLDSKFDEKGLALSPDGNWFAYSSDEGGASDVYVRRVEPGSPRWRVSEGGGVEPRWARTGEVFFRRGDSLMVSRVVTSGVEPGISTAQLVVRGDYDMSMFEPMWDVSPDGRRFIFVRHSASGRLKVMLMLNWMDMLRAPSRP